MTAMHLLQPLPPTAQRVAQNTAPALNAAIRARADASVARLSQADPAQLEARLGELAREWDVERLLQVNAPVLVLAGLALGRWHDRRFLLLPTAVFAFLAQHALQGWCPPIPVFRRLGVRTRGEIERERQALKALRGDYDALPAAGAAPTAVRVQAALAAVDR